MHCKMKAKKKYMKGGKLYKAGGLTPKQKQLDKNKDGKISGEDFKMMKKGGKLYKNGGKIKKEGDPLMEKAKKNFNRMLDADKSTAGRARASSLRSKSTTQRNVELSGANFKKDTKTGRPLAPRTMVPRGSAPEQTRLERSRRGIQSKNERMQVPRVKKPKGLKGRT